MPSGLPVPLRRAALAGTLGLLAVTSCSGSPRATSGGSATPGAPSASTAVTSGSAGASRQPVTPSPATGPLAGDAAVVSVAGSGSDDLAVFSAIDRTLLRTLPGTTGSWRLFHEDGLGNVYYVTRTPPGPVAWRVPLTGGTPQQVRALTGAVTAVVPSPDGSRLAWVAADPAQPQGGPAALETALGSGPATRVSAWAGGTPAVIPLGFADPATLVVAQQQAGAVVVSSLPVTGGPARTLARVPLTIWPGTLTDCGRATWAAARSASGRIAVVVAGCGIRPSDPAPVAEVISPGGASQLATLPGSAGYFPQQAVFAGTGDLLEVELTHQDCQATRLPGAALWAVLGDPPTGPTAAC